MLHSFSRLLPYFIAPIIWARIALHTMYWLELYLLVKKNLSLYKIFGGNYISDKFYRYIINDYV